MKNKKLIVIHAMGAPIVLSAESLQGDNVVDLDLMGTFSVAVPLQLVSVNEPLWKAIVNEQTHGADAIQMQAACKGINPEEMN